MEKPVEISVEGGGLTLEGLLQQGRIGRNAVLCHPHPLLGGNMQNNVVGAAGRAFAGEGWGTLRFNFRGVGGSGGQPAQNLKDAEDLAVVSEYLKDRQPGQIDFAGYSYGAWAVMQAVRLGLTPDSLVLVSPPLDFISFEGLELPQIPALVIAGNQDEFCSLGSLRKWLSARPDAPVSLEIIPYADHFYWGLEELLAKKITEFLKREFGEKN